MASYSVDHEKHATLSGTTVDVVTCNRTNTDSVTVWNQDTAEVIYLSVSGSDPAAGGDDTRVVPAGGARELHLYPQQCEVRLIGNGNVYTVAFGD